MESKFELSLIPKSSLLNLLKPNDLPQMYYLNFKDEETKIQRKSGAFY